MRPEEIAKKMYNSVKTFKGNLVTTVESKNISINYSYDFVYKKPNMMRMESEDMLF